MADGETMRFRIALGKWAGAETDMPTVVAACNEYDEDAWGGQTPDWYDEAIDQHRKANGEVREIRIRVPEQAVVDLFNVVDTAATVEA